MPRMTGCTVNNLCQDTPNDPWCDPFKSYKLICGGSMRMMNGCMDYNSMCNASSKVLQCQTSILPIPEGSVLIKNISSICGSMPMEGCELCGNLSSSCDTLSVYSSLCYQMPGMPECSYWKTYCKLISNWTLCAGYPGQLVPQMKMYFHFGFQDYILFKEWVPQNAGQYWAAILGIFIATVLFEALRALHAMFETRERDLNTEKSENQPLMPKHDTQSSKNDLGLNLFRAFFRAAEFTVAYFLMLIAMTFNVGFFIALIVGIFIGTFIFGRFHFSDNPNRILIQIINSHKQNNIWMSQLSQYLNFMIELIELINMLCTVSFDSKKIRTS